MHGSVHVILLSGRKVLDSLQADALGEALRSYIERIEAPKVVLDLGSIEQLSSAALSMLLATKSTAAIRGGRLCLANVGDDLLEMLKVTKLDTVLPIHKSTDDAVQSLA
ncbi:MAG: STAS domain-containing protein [Planctomycetota bacterium]